MANKMFVLNLGSTSTKVAVYEDTNEIVKETLQHSQEDLQQFHRITDQKEFRKKAILTFLTKHNFHLNLFDCIVARGGCTKPIEGGIYYITEEMLKDMKSGIYGMHVSNVGCMIAYELSQEYQIPVITADTVSTDELCSFARYSGIKEAPRVSTFHALNHKAIARKYAKEIGRAYEDLNLVVVHLGGGISVGTHKKGHVIDTNNALEGDGSFSPERAGTLPVGSVVRMCFSGKYTEDQMLHHLRGGGGLMSYLGTNSGLEVEERIANGDSYAKEVFEAMAYQVAKEIGAASTILKGKVDAILLTGSLAYSDLFTDWLIERISFLAPVHKYPGENEMLSLAENGIRFLNKEEDVKKY
ncbi:butyrate kinase [Sinanaerobacter sp. ZZT-01]|uniref:butyrate kinase n=1 Tax=Sinanaerobacter sp. ZZT-01 TaxID=3111540 RepID=UPI002D76BAE9|nr:butyrate kinase [Sinanaerobacter sp. ZZT-01]WRR94614.1 butyrate kinase [Sinanaerobacter sp. ZZT-01]